MGDESYSECRAQELYDEFVSASTCRTALRTFTQLCEHLQLDRSAAERPLYQIIKRRLNYWRANTLWTKLDRRANQQEYLRARICNNTTCVIIGAGPCGLRTAVELSFMGARVVLLEKRDSFSRNNVLHLWPFTIHDLRGLGAKKFYGKFCAGSIDHISIRQLQLVLLKVALLLGVEVHVNVEFKNLVEPPEDQHRHKVGWRMEVSPKSHPVNQLVFDVIIGADGRRNTLPGFRRKEFRGKLAIAITANFKNRNTTAEAKVEEISGVAFIFNQRFFQELRQETGIDLENIVYYKDDTHYFVMTAKKQSLLEKGVILQDFSDTERLLSRGNVDQNALQAYAREAADFSTNHQLPSLDFAMNHYGQPDVAMFDFTCMYASENAAMVRQRHGHQLLVTLVGDSLLEPFWPMGTGVARGFLAALDSAWMIRSWAQGGVPLDVLAERENLYRLLPQTTPENMQKNISLFSVDPTTRYLNVNPPTITPAQVRHLVDTGEEVGLITDCGDIIRLPSPRILREESFSQSNQLLTWCQKQTHGYYGVTVNDLTTSWKSGLALCALIHRYRPDLIDFESLDESSVEENTRLGFDVAEREFGISPLMTVEEMSAVGEPDSLSMVMYLSQFYQLLKDSPPPAGCLYQSADLRSALITPASLLSRLGHSPSRKRNPKLPVNEQKDAASKKRKTSRPGEEQQESCDLNGDIDSQVGDEAFVGRSSGSRVRLMANQLQAKMDENLSTCRSSSSSAAALRRQQGEVLSSLPPPSESAEAAAQPSSWRPKKRTLQQEQMSFRFKEKIKSQSVVSRDEQCLQMYTGGVSSLAEQITDQIQSQDEVSLFAVSCSDVCFFCKNRVYVMERLSAEGLFFHRSCFQCDFCSSTLRLAAYTYDQHSGRFYCLQHYDCRLDAPTVRKRPTASDRATSHRTSIASLASAPSLTSTDSLISADHRRSSVVSVMAATPERIELENCRQSSTKVETELQEEAEEPEEVSEETLNQFNLNLDQKHNHSSESEMEEEARGGSQRHVTSEETKASWRETVQLHLHLRDEEEDEEDEGDEEEGGSEVETSDEGEYSPWEMERHSGLWLLLEEETEEEFPPLPSQSVSSAAGSDTTCSDTPVEPDSTSSPLPCVSSPTPSSVTPPPGPRPPPSPSSPHLTPPTARTETQLRPPSSRLPSSWKQSLRDASRSHLMPSAPNCRHRRERRSQRWMREGDIKELAASPQAYSSPLCRVGAGLSSSQRGWEAPPPGQVGVEGGGARALWRAVFSGNKKEKKKKRGRTLPSEKVKKEAANQRRAADVIGRLSLTEESDLDSSMLLQRCSLTPTNNRHSVKDRVLLQDSDGQSSCPTEVLGVLVQPKEPSSLSMKESLFQRERENEDVDLDAKITRRVQRAARRQAKQEQLKRLHKAQMIQRQLQQVEEKQRQLEERGVMVEKALRGEADYWGDSNDSQDIDLHLGGLGKLDNPALMQQWFQLVQQKNSLVRYESELMIFARELELEDRQSRLQQGLRERMAVDDHLKEDWQLVEERLILEEMLEVVEQRDALVSLLEEQRLQERQEDQDLEGVMMTRALGLS
ncbi:LOW QUALITY PROTEIN: protein-methionine sulfoxide oxidase mical3b-like [Lates calcarifer]|uniref:F-actin monooxygenase n=1 Tax=Lates calcarifer TaxID=8187 RepID=A0AAJ8DWR6_LATCA|nr:LOW QUALITY PROTEIN: protein-methionine sulfoxide oxidase mical3b-like [Lates calcarifer]